MTRKAKKATKDDATRVRRKTKPWGSDRARPDTPSSLEVLMAWLTTPGNAERWRREKHKGLVKEVVQALRASGIEHREGGDVQHKIRFMEIHFSAAAAHLIRTNQADAFLRGETDPETVEAVLKLCPQYRELLPVFGRRAQANGEATGGKSNGAVAVAAGGEWKKSLEKYRHTAAAEEPTQGNGGGGKDVETIPRAANGVASTGKTAGKDAGKSGGANKSEGIGQQDDVIVAAVDEENRNEKEETDRIPEAEANAESESSEEEEKPHTRVAVKTGVRSLFKTKRKQSDSEESSSEDEDSDESQEKSESESEQEEDVGGEERIPLAQPDEVDAGTTGEEGEQAERSEVDDDADKSKAEESEESEESEETEEEEVEEEPEQDSSKAAANSSGGSSSSSSESESEDGDTEEEVPPTQLKAPSDQDEGSEGDESKNDEDDNAVDVGGKDAEKPVEQNDSDAPKPIEQSESEVESESPVAKRTSRKRSSSSKSSSSSTAKRPRADSAANDATRDLEREAFVERAKQERDQRDELFQLERAKLECELQAKQVQLAMERSLARKKLLGAGIDPAEVDHVLPL
ncbi:hypothetical protein PHYPSEUDO_009540 [Phytophthora pseudosyringae]|uniref:Uncharacterized protein n=1 Tax=Phytophthora pseudosyringae TaxID=221518 RepID=A0A8T1WIU7_9STRA|nr:hypothetical protein PHYPSEUDO_009540 [Phytophthora pseudosyringae]